MRIIQGSEWVEKSEEWLIPSLICDSLTLLSGEPKTGKTSLACHIARGLISGTEILGKQPSVSNYRIGWMGFDSKWRREIQTRIPDLMKNVFFIDPVGYKDLNQWGELTAEFQKQNLDFLVIDHLYGFGAGADLDRQFQVQEVLLPLNRFMAETNAGVLLLAHAPKGSDGRVAHSMASEGAARWLLRLKGFGKVKTLDSLGNNAEAEKRRIKLNPYSASLADAPTKNSETSKSADGGLPERARFILANCPTDIRSNAKAIGKWLSEQGVGIETAGSGRTAVNVLLKSKLLKRMSPKGEITAGPKLVQELTV